MRDTPLASMCSRVRAVALRRGSGPSRAKSRDGGRLRLIALTDQADVVQRILRHLQLPTEVPEPRPRRAPPLLEACSFDEDTDGDAFNPCA